MCNLDLNPEFKRKKLYITELYFKMSSNLETLSVKFNVDSENKFIFYLLLFYNYNSSLNF